MTGEFSIEEGARSEGLSDLIGMIYDAAFAPNLWTEVLRRIASFAPAASATLYAHDRVARLPDFSYSYGADPRFTADYVERWAAGNPIIEAMAALAPGEVSGLAGILDYEVFSRSPFFVEWGRPQGLCDAANLILERTPTRIAALSLHRHDEHGIVDKATLGRIRLLAPHLLRAVTIGRLFDHAKVERDQLRQAIDAMADAVFLIDAAGEIVHANMAADQLRKAGFRPGKAGVKQGEQAPGASPLQGDVTLVEIAQGRQHFCHLLPLDRQGEDHPAPLVLATVRSAGDSIEAAESVKRLYALTDRERDVLIGLVETDGLPATARMLGIARNTARAHAKRLFQKTGARRQADLVALMGRAMSPYRST